MELGAHLPLIPFGEAQWTPGTMRDHAARASALGYRWLAANDHLVFRRPWLDGLTALASVAGASADLGLGLATTVCLPAVRGPAQTAKAVAALDLLSGGRLAAGVGPGSSERDCALAGVDPAHRFSRFEESVRALRVFLGRDPGPFHGRFHHAADALEPRPAAGRPPVWMAGWGAPRGLRRAAALGDGWLASAYNTTPERFAAAWADVRGHVAARGGDPDGFANGLATMWTYVTEDRATRDRMLADVLSPLVGRAPEELRATPLLIGPADECAARLAAYRDAGVQRVFVWPLGDAAEQLRLVAERVMPAMPAP